MKIYKNPFVSYQSFFIPTGPAKTGKAEAKATKGYLIENMSGKWEIKSGSYYNHTLNRELPVVGEVDRKKLKDAVIKCVLNAVKER